MKDFLAENGELIYINAINTGLDNRLMRSTNMNETSSRSHLLISLVLKFKERGTGRRRTGKITFIDLAGSERLALIGADAGLYEEALFINESLTYLGFVVRQLSRKFDYRRIGF